MPTIAMDCSHLKGTGLHIDSILAGSVELVAREHCMTVM